MCVFQCSWRRDEACRLPSSSYISTLLLDNLAMTEVNVLVAVVVNWIFDGTSVNLVLFEGNVMVCAIFYPSLDGILVFIRAKP
jgi:hypothetical protein